MARYIAFSYPYKGYSLMQVRSNFDLTLIIELFLVIYDILLRLHNVSKVKKICKVAWPSGLRRWFKAPVSSEAWVRIPPLP